MPLLASTENQINLRHPYPYNRHDAINKWQLILSIRDRWLAQGSVRVNQDYADKGSVPNRVVMLVMMIMVIMMFMVTMVIKVIMVIIMVVAHSQDKPRFKGSVPRKVSMMITIQI